MTKTFKALLMGGAAAVAMTGMAHADAHGDAITACLITKTDTNPFFVKMREGATEAAEAAGINLQTYAGAIDGDVESQVAAVETCIAAGASGILITPSDSRALAPVIGQARGRLLGTQDQTLREGDNNRNKFEYRSDAQTEVGPRQHCPSIRHS